MKLFSFSKLSTFLVYHLLSTSFCLTVTPANKHVSNHKFSYLKKITRSALSPAQETQLLTIIKNFFDTQSYPHKSFVAFAQDIIDLLGSNPVYKNFCADLNKHKYTSSPLLLGIYLGQYKPLMPDSVSRIVAQKKTSEILSVIKDRMSKNSR